MPEKIYPITYNKEFYAVAANDIIRGKQEMTMTEAKIIRLLITQVVKEDKDLKTYRVNIKELARFLGIDDSNLYRNVREISESLLGRKIKIGTSDPRQPWKIFQWIQIAEYDGKGMLTLMLSEQLKPYVLELNGWFTQYQLQNILHMQSFYAIRLYELIKMKDGVQREEKSQTEFYIEELRQYFGCEDKFKKFADFRIKVIETAIREINDKTDIYITAEYIKKGRKISRAMFTQHVNFSVLKEREEKDYENIFTNFKGK